MSCWGKQSIITELTGANSRAEKIRKEEERAVIIGRQIEAQLIAEAEHAAAEALARIQWKRRALERAQEARRRQEFAA